MGSDTILYFSNAFDTFVLFIYIEYIIFLFKSPNSWNSFRISMKFIPLSENIVLHNLSRAMNLCKQFK